MSRFIHGIHPALEALRSSPGQVERVFLQPGPHGGSLGEVAEAVRALGLTSETVPRRQLDRLAAGGVHQGVVLRLADFAYADLDGLLARARPEGLLLLLDGIEDPHNFGALVRSASALGAQGVVIAKDRAAGVTGAAVKASAGAVAHLAIARVTNLVRALDQAKEAGFWVVGADASGDQTPEQVDLRAPIALVLGSEGSGMRRLVRERCDFLVRIPMTGPVASLNASVAGGILLAEVARQRRLPSTLPGAPAQRA